MSLGISSAKLGAGQGAPQVRTSRKHLVTPSIAEQAIFIPKPHKRVDFKLQATGLKPLGADGAPSSEPIPLPGQKTGKSDVEVSGSNIRQGSFGTHGLTARFGKDAWAGAPGGYVKMEVDMTPTKQHEVIAPQEEGRQVNHHQIHFTQQYDAYGRPRIGFSREPYDFAATKYMSITSQLAFQQNMAKTHEVYNEYRDKLLAEEDKGRVDPEAMVMGAGKEDIAEVPIFGETSDVEKDRETKKVSDDIFLGDKPKEDKPGKEQDDEQRVTAQESYEKQKVKLVDVFSDVKTGAAPDSPDSPSGGPDGGEVGKTLDISV